MCEKKESKDELRARLRRSLVECGIDPDLEDFKQLQSDDKLIKVCEKRVANIAAHREAIAKLRPNKAQIAEEAGLSRTSISESHNPNLLKIYNSFFPKEIKDTVSITDYNNLKKDYEKLEKKLDGDTITQARLITALDDKKKLENKVRLQAESIKNLVKIINELKQTYLEQTGEILNIDLTNVLKDPEKEEEEDLRKKISVPIINAAGLQS